SREGSLSRSIIQAGPLRSLPAPHTVAAVAADRLWGQLAMNRRTVLYALGVGLLTVPLVAEAQPPIRIGASSSQTGAYAALGQNQLRGYQLCVKDTNNKGGVLGRRLELVHYDNGSDPATAVRLYEKFLTQDKVDLVLAPHSGPITDAVADVTEKRKL